jgi:hypothetical protein
MGWIAQGVNNGSRPVKYLRPERRHAVHARRTVVNPNLLNESGLGAVLVTAYLAVGQPIRTRCWTASHGSGRTSRTLRAPVSLAFPSIGGLRLVRERLRVRSRAAARHGLPHERRDREPGFAGAHVDGTANGETGS